MLAQANLQRKVEEVIINFEPRVRLVQIVARPNYDTNAYDLKIMFYVFRIKEI